jgi:hypothetical protein
MAAPYISAACAYVKMVEPNMNNEGVKKILESYSLDLGDTGKDKYYGYGCPYMADYFKNSFAEAYVGMCLLKSVKNSEGGLTLSWTKVADATGYKVYRKSTTTGYKCIATITSQATSTYLDAKAVSGQKYRYVVRAVENGKEGQYANSIVTVRLSQPKCKVINGAKGIVISWSKYAGATKYRLYRKVAGQSKWTAIATVKSTKTSYTDTKVTGGKTYIYTIRAFYNSDIYSSCNATGFKMYRMSSRTIASLTSNSKGKMVVKWNAVGGVNGYQLQYSSKPDFSTYKLVKIAGKTSNKKTITGLKSGATYYVRVRSYRTIGSVTYYGGWGVYKKVKVK